MSSVDKTLLVEFFRGHPNTFICNIGKSDSDTDSIFYSNIGINFKRPKNINTLLFHFYNSNHDISCIKNIIMEGRVFFENSILLELVSFVCTLTLNSFILCSLIRNTDVNDGELQFLEIEILVLLVSSFIGDTKKNLIVIPLTENKKLLKIYYFFQMIGIFLIKLISLFIFSSLYFSDYRTPIERMDVIFVNYYFVLCIEFIVCIIFSFNYISFYRKSPFSNNILRILTILIILYIVILISLNSSNYHCDFLGITSFEFSIYLIDSFSENNRMYLVYVCILDFIATILFSQLIYVIFSKIANNTSSINKREP